MNNDNKNKLFGGLGPKKAGELGGEAHHKCRGRECDEAHEHAKHSKTHENVTSKNATSKSVSKSGSDLEKEYSKHAKHEHNSDKC